MTQPPRPDPARPRPRNNHVCPGPAPSGAVRPARRAVGTLALHIGTRAQPGRPAELPLASTARRYVRRLAGSATWPIRPRGLVPGWTVISAGLSPALATGGWLVADAVQPTSRWSMSPRVPEDGSVTVPKLAMRQPTGERRDDLVQRLKQRGVHLEPAGEVLQPPP